MHNFLKNGIFCEDMERIFDAREDWQLLQNSCVYITGAAGMIASYLVMFLIYLNEKKGYNVEIYAGVRNAEKAVSRFGMYVEKSYFHIDVRDAIETLDESIKVDFIIHAASLASPQYYGKMPVETILPNVVGTYALLEYARKKNVKSFLFFSSGSVYGSISGIDTVDETAIGKLNFLATGDFYGESKRCGEALCRAYSMEYHVPVKSARIHHTYGPTLDPFNDTRVFSEFVGNILNNQDIIMKSAGTAKRAFCYLTDTVIALFFILLDGQNGESYNVGNNEEYISISELAEKLVKLFPEKNLAVRYEERNMKGYASSEASKTIPLSIDKVKELGYRPSTAVNEGFYRTIVALREIL